MSYCGRPTLLPTGEKKQCPDLTLLYRDTCGAQNLGKRWAVQGNGPRLWALEANCPGSRPLLTSCVNLGLVVVTPVGLCGFPEMRLAVPIAQRLVHDEHSASGKRGGSNGSDENNDLSVPAAAVALGTVLTILCGLCSYSVR